MANWSNELANVDAAEKAKGWECVPRYNPGVLIGNWFEDRRRCMREPFKADSTYHSDFRKFTPIELKHRLNELNQTKYDTMCRAKWGKGPILANRHLPPIGSPYISTYDVYYNRRLKEHLLTEEAPDGTTPTMTRFTTKTTAMKNLAEPTNFGLGDRKRREWDAEKRLLFSPGNSVYRDLHPYLSRDAYLSQLRSVEENKQNGNECTHDTATGLTDATSGLVPPHFLPRICPDKSDAVDFLSRICPDKSHAVDCTCSHHMIKIPAAITVPCEPRD